jgi:CelD/BcsL family acetyltransferase involved in cellulose biosynthesis
MTSANLMQILDPAAEPQWDQVVQGRPECSLFHTAAWSTVLKETYGYTPVYLKICSQGGSLAVWPIMEVNSRWTGRRGVSLPFTDECAPLVDSTRSAKELLSAALDLARARRWRYFEFRGGGIHFAGIRASVSYVTHTLPLSRDTELLFNGCDSATRRAVRKARQSGVRVELSREADAVKTFYSLQCRTRRKHGLPPQPFTFFKNIHRYVISRDKGFVATAYYQERAIASAVYFQQGMEAIFKFGASDENYLSLRGNNLVMWTAIEHCASRNCRVLHFGRTSRSNEGLRRYKQGWGAQEHSLDYFRYDPRQEAFVGGADRASGWHNGMFRLLPGPLVRWVGAGLYRHLG